MTKIYVVESERCRDCGEVVGARYDYKERVVWIDNGQVCRGWVDPGPQYRRCKTCEAIAALRDFATPVEDEDDK